MSRACSKADSLNMKVLLDVVSHFSRANYAYAYSMPVYIVDSSGKLTRRAGWDGESDQWFDSFMVNMRDYDSIEALSTLYKELAGMGFGLRIDVGHGFDTVFPVDQRVSSSARLFGEVVTGGSERVDLRGTWESCAPILKICYEVQKAIPDALIAYSEQWHGNEARMIKSGTFPYNPFIKNVESIRDGQDVNAAYGLNDTITYLNKVYRDCGGQTLSFFNTHDEESPPSNYQNMEGGRRYVRHEPWNMDGTTVLEYLMSTDRRIQYVICGRVEDSFDGRRFDMHLRRIARSARFKGHFAYYPEGSLSAALYRDIYLGSQYFVMPSGGEIGEPCGISQQEAHAEGTPVIAHNQDGLKRTVSDKRFGDTRHPSNGIKFIGFTGEALLDALLDAVEIYYHGRRLNYVDDKGRHRKQRYSDLSFNAFHTDHRWLRLLRDYIDMYATVLGAQLPCHLDTVRLIAEMASACDENLCSAVLRKGIRMVEAADYLTEALSCEIPSVRSAAGQTLVRLDHMLRDEGRLDIEGRLRHAAESPNKTMSGAAVCYIARLLK